MEEMRVVERGERLFFWLLGIVGWGWGDFGMGERRKEREDEMREYGQRTRVNDGVMGDIEVEDSSEG